MATACFGGRKLRRYKVISYFNQHISSIGNITGSRIYRYEHQFKSTHTIILVRYRIIRSHRCNIGCVISKIPDVAFSFSQRIGKFYSKRHATNGINNPVYSSFYTSPYPSKVHFYFYHCLITINRKIIGSPHTGCSWEKYVGCISTIGAYSLVNNSIFVKAACTPIYMIVKSFILSKKTSKQLTSCIFFQYKKEKIITICCRFYCIRGN